MNPVTQARLDRIVSLVSDQITPGRAAALREVAEFLLREQDRDTRHACADAVVAESAKISKECGKTQVSADTWAIACGSAMERACMNVQAV